MAALDLPGYPGTLGHAATRCSCPATAPQPAAVPIPARTGLFRAHALNARGRFVPRIRPAGYAPLRQPCRPPQRPKAASPSPRLTNREGDAATALLFGARDRAWPRKWVQRVCRLARVPVVTAHGMRGLHATLALQAGTSGHIVAASLGHESISTTLRSYADRNVVAGADQRRALNKLTGEEREE